MVKKGNCRFRAAWENRREAELLCEDATAPESESEAACETVELADGWSLEISLDIEMAHAICQNCHRARGVGKQYRRELGSG
jgi:hypothetical protein